MKLTLDQIHYKFGGIGTDTLDQAQQGRLYKVLQELPEDIVDFAAENIWLVSSNDYHWAFCQRLEDIKKTTKAIVFISEKLWDQVSLPAKAAAEMAPQDHSQLAKAAPRESPPRPVLRRQI